MSNIRTTTQSNQITLSRSNFTIPQRRVLYAIIETLSPFFREGFDSRGKEVSRSIKLDDISTIVYKASDLCRPEQYAELRAALSQLRSRNFFIETEDEEILTGLILRAKFPKRSEYIELLIDEKLYDICFDLSKGYTLYQTKVALSFTSTYAMKLYELVAKWRSVPKFYIDIDELRRLTDTLGKYTKVAQFKRRVLDIAKEQLDNSDSTDLRFKYIEKKKGKMIIGFDIIVIKTDKSHEHEQQLKIHAPSLRWDFKKSLIDNFAVYSIVVKGETANTIKAYQAKFGENKLAQDLESFAKLAEKNNARSIPAYIMSCFKKGLNHVATNVVTKPVTTQKQYEKEPWEMNKDERVAHAMKIRAESESSDGLKKIGDIFGNLKK